MPREPNAYLAPLHLVPVLASSVAAEHTSRVNSLHEPLASAHGPAAGAPWHTVRPSGTADSAGSPAECPPRGLGSKAWRVAGASLTHPGRPVRQGGRRSSGQQCFLPATPASGGGIRLHPFPGAGRAVSHLRGLATRPAGRPIGLRLRCRRRPGPSARGPPHGARTRPQGVRTPPYAATSFWSSGEARKPARGGHAQPPTSPLTGWRERTRPAPPGRGGRTARRAGPARSPSPRGRPGRRPAARRR